MRIQSRDNTILHIVKDKILFYLKVDVHLSTSRADSSAKVCFIGVVNSFRKIVNEESDVDNNGNPFIRDVAKYLNLSIESIRYHMRNLKNHRNIDKKMYLLIDSITEEIKKELPEYNLAENKLITIKKYLETELERVNNLLSYNGTTIN